MSYVTGVDVTANDASAKFALGQIAQTADGKKYKYVLFNNGAGSVASVAQGAAYYYAAGGTATAASEYTVTMDVTDSIGVGAGTFNAVITDGNYCWVQISGPVTVAVTLTAGADGNVITAVGAGADGTFDVTAAATSAPSGYIIDASADLVFLQCPE